MPDPLEELRQQRALLQQHLNWLDRKIAELDDAPAAKEAKEASQSKARAPTSNEPIPPTEKQEVGIEDIVPEYANSSIDLDRLKLGCVGVVIGAILLFLFLLFGLPYLIG